MATIALPPQLTMADAHQALERLRPRVESDPAPHIDASALATLDTSAIAVLLELRRTAAAAGAVLTIDGVPAKLSDLARLYGVAALLALAD